MSKAQGILDKSFSRACGAIKKGKNIEEWVSKQLFAYLYKGEKPLLHAICGAKDIQYEHIERFVNYYHLNGGNINITDSKGRTVFYYITKEYAGKGDNPTAKKIFTLLKDKGVHIDQPGVMNIKDRQQKGKEEDKEKKEEKCTPAYFFAVKDNVKLLAHLVTLGVDLTVPSLEKEWTILHLASAKRSGRQIDLLLEQKLPGKGKDLREQFDKQENSPLHLFLGFDTDESKEIPLQSAIQPMTLEKMEKYIRKLATPKVVLHKNKKGDLPIHQLVRIHAKTEEEKTSVEKSVLYVVAKMRETEQGEAMLLTGDQTLSQDTLSWLEKRGNTKARDAVMRVLVEISQKKHEKDLPSLALALQAPVVSSSFPPPILSASPSFLPLSSVTGVSLSLPPSALLFSQEVVDPGLTGKQVGMVSPVEEVKLHTRARSRVKKMKDPAELPTKALLKVFEDDDDKNENNNKERNRSWQDKEHDPGKKAGGGGRGRGSERRNLVAPFREEVSS